MRPTATWRSLLSWALLLALFACSSPREEPPAYIPPAEQESTSYTAPTDQPLVINDGANQNLATISAGAEIEVNTPEMTVFGVLKRADKRKYYDQNDQLRFTVKLKDDGFKLRDQNEELLWKVKVYPDRIKVADNEEMDNAWKIKQSESGKLKILQNEEEIKAVRPVKEPVTLQLGDNHILSGLSSDLHGGVLLLEALTPMEQYLIIAELEQFVP